MTKNAVFHIMLGEHNVQFGFLYQSPESVLVAWPAIDTRNLVDFLQVSSMSTSYSIPSSRRIG